MAAVETVAVAMARTLRGLGVPTPPDASIAYAAALAEVGVERRSAAYWAGRATLIRRPEDIPAFDRAFAAVFEGRMPSEDEDTAPETESVTMVVDTEDEPPLGWVNPLKASPGFAPLALGMAAALPHVDEFVEGHSIASLEALAEVVTR